MRVCFDTNVVIDILGKSEWFATSFAAYDVANLNKFDTCLAASAIPDIAYILQRRGLSPKRMRAALPDLLEMFDILDVTASDCQQAIDSEMDDIEDAVIAASAQRNAIDLIITRNERGFKDAPIASMTPFDFMRHFKPANIDYAEINETL